ncbi:GAF and ANTAR domain-containing protein [Paenarthrobacter sp. PH39-S1]|uniref:GAF and ANTAR domain-containing protein n=1 Tax=Paenarthrobacter sp. PH39-S1 TaxID=3046204 RepID=UPI0024BBDE72|nr:GAF and ANTAR domain-containing protein [Paenarthrobacter sp. PH39-S1]MDJ0358240.1 GAF and ANTAR domain-containing protein [Paenarthrobacter sp. PH39-S1]
MTDTGPLGILAATDGPAQVLEELQFTLGEGPCIDSSVSGRPVLQPELALTGESRWLGFTAGALEAGVKAIFAFPLQVGGIRIGVLELYRDAEGELGSGELVEALAFSDAAVSVLLHLQSEAGPGTVHPALAAGVSDRSEVHQATGMIAGQHSLTLTQALVMLRARAYAAERPILDIARDVLSRRLVLGDLHAGD